MTQADRTPTTPLPALRRVPSSAPTVTEHTPPRRAVRRRFLLEAGATIAASLGVTVAVLSPDPVWGAADRRGATTLPDPDAELIALCRQTLAANAAFEAHANRWGDTVHVPAHASAEESRLCTATAELVKQVAALPAHTASGLHAKADVVRAWWGETLDAAPASLVADVLRLMDAQVPA